MLLEPAGEEVAMAGIVVDDEDAAAAEGQGGGGRGEEGTGEGEGLGLGGRGDRGSGGGGGFEACGGEFAVDEPEERVGGALDLVQVRGEFGQGRGFGLFEEEFAIAEGVVEGVRSSAWR
ncbi:MAG: hypothetical protein M5U12_26515 [Verrucomicrobia bacterium]|nr:hypothetical protein [Verrucomicrobiota bacterium]